MMRPGSHPLPLCLALLSACAPLEAADEPRSCDEEFYAGVEGGAELTLWNRLGSVQQLDESCVGPPVRPVGVPSFASDEVVPGLLAQGTTPVATIPSGVLSASRGTVCIELGILRLTPGLTNAQDILLLSNQTGPGAPEAGAHIDDDFVLAFTSNDGLAHSGWIGRVSQAAGSFAIDAFGNTSTATLGAAAERVHACLTWDNESLRGSDGDKVAVYVNGAKEGRSYDRNEAPWPTDLERPVALHGRAFNPDYADGPPDAELVYDDIKVWSAALDESTIEAIAVGANGA